MSGPLATTWRALGTSATVAVAEPRRLEAAVTAVRAELAAIDAACSRFRDDAELVALNASAGRRVRVSPLLFEALEVAVEAARATGGAVDPTVGAALERVGYDRDLGDIAPDGPPLPSRTVAPGSIRTGGSVMASRATASEWSRSIQASRPRVVTHPSGVPVWRPDTTTACMRCRRIACRTWTSEASSTTLRTPGLIRSRTGVSRWSPRT
jgi:FAD:protein FMN transferase